MRSAALWSLILYALALGNDPVWASGATRGLPTDDKVAIVHKPSELLLGSCNKLPAPIMNVRLQTLITKSGTIFQRKAVTESKFACLSALGSQTLAAGNILECFGQTEAAGLKMFRWDAGQCTGYTHGIPMRITRCAGAGSVVLYSVDDVQAINPVVSNITLAFSDDLLVNATWNVTPNSCFNTYLVRFNNIDTDVSDELALVHLEALSPCAEYPLTVTPVDVNSAVIGPAASATVVVPKGLELFLNLTHGVTVVKASWAAEYTCNPNKKPTAGRTIQSYKVKLGDETVDTDDSPVTFGMSFDRCSDNASRLAPKHNEVTLEAFDGNDVLLDNVTAILTDTIMPGHRYLSARKNCIYLQKLEEMPDGVGLPYAKLLDFCEKMFSGIVTDHFPLTGYMNDLASIETLTPSVNFPSQYLGVKFERKSGKWKWIAGGVLPLTDDRWASGEPSTAGDCVELNANKKLAAVSCDATRAIVCYDFFF